MMAVTLNNHEDQKPGSIQSSRVQRGRRAFVISVCGADSLPAFAAYYCPARNVLGIAPERGDTAFHVNLSDLDLYSVLCRRHKHTNTQRKVRQ